MKYAVQCKFCGAPEHEAFGRERTIYLPATLYSFLLSSLASSARYFSPDEFSTRQLAWAEADASYVLKPVGGGK